MFYFKFNRLWLGIVSALLLQVSCQVSEQNTKQKTNPKTHQSPQVPQGMNNLFEQETFMIKHYWNRFDFKDKSILTSLDEYEILVSDFLSLIVSADEKSYSSEDLLYPLEHTTDSILAETLKLYRKYLYEANSPLAHEQSFKQVLKWELETPRMNKEQKEEARLLLDLVSKNKVGTMATDFIYELKDGSKHHLYNLLRPHTLVIFAQKDCEQCSFIRDILSENANLQNEVKSGRLEILYLYLGTKPNEVELDTKLSQFITFAFDSEDKVMSQQLYDIKAFPTLYLIRRGGEVALKDCSLSYCENYLTNNYIYSK